MNFTCVILKSMQEYFQVNILDDSGANDAKLKCDEGRGNCCARLTFDWLTPVLKKGAEQPLKFDDCVELPEYFDTVTTSRKFASTWYEYRRVHDKVHPWRSLAYILLKAQSSRLVASALCTVAACILQFLVPFLIQFILIHMTADSVDLWGGVVLSVALFLVLMFLGLAENWAAWGETRLSHEVKTSLRAIIFQKSLRVPSSLPRGYASNLMDVDPNKISRSVSSLNSLWNMPLRLVVALYLLYQYLGISALVGVALLTCMIPFNYWISKEFFSTTKAIVKYKDVRIRYLSEILQGILTVKLNSWEHKIAERADKIRAKEIVKVRRFNNLIALFMFLVVSINTVVCAVVFSTYVLLGNQLSAEKIFPSMILIEMLRWPILDMPECVGQVSTAIISLKRITFFLTLPEIERQFRQAMDQRNILLSSSHNGRNITKRLCIDLSLSGQSTLEYHKELIIDDASSSDDDEEDLNAFAEGECLVFGDNDSQELFPDAQAERIAREIQSFSIPDASEASPSDNNNQDGFRGLRDIKLKAHAGALIGIVGKVGAGKSTLLKALLGELGSHKEPKSHNISEDSIDHFQRDLSYINGTVSYTAQEAWIRNASVRDNITMNLSFDRERYDQTIKACCLKSDLDQLPFGDLTEIGEKGVNLSGGQKARVSLARAVYNDSEVCLLDDPLSAVDAHVGHKMFFDCINGPLMKHRCRVLVTHQLQFVSHCDYVYVMDSGRVIREGLPTSGLLDGIPTATDHKDKSNDCVELIDSNEGHISMTLEERKYSSIGPVGAPPAAPTINRAYSDPLADVLTLQTSTAVKLAQMTSPVQSPKRGEQDDDAPIFERSDRKKMMAFGAPPPPPDSQIPRSNTDSFDTEYWSNLHRVFSSEENQSKAANETHTIGRTTEDEERQTGSVKWPVYSEYLQHVGGVWGGINLLVISIFLEGTSQLSQVWLGVWTDDSSSSSSSWYSGHSPGFYLFIFISLSVLVALCSLARQFIWAKYCSDASVVIHDNLLWAVLRAPLSWFHKIPSGRVINRFSNDIDRIDTDIPDLISDYFLCMLAIVGLCITIVSISPWLSIPLLPIALMYYQVQRYYSMSCTELGRIGSIRSTPIFTHYLETLNGLDSVRAYEMQTDLVRENEILLRDYSRVNYTILACTRWLGLRIDWMGAMLRGLVALSLVLLSATQYSVSPGMIGLLLTISSSVTSNLNWFVRVSTKVKGSFNSVERVFHFSKTEPEAPLFLNVGNRKDTKSITEANTGISVDPEWPKHGAIEFQNVWMRYNATAPAVLRQVTFKIAAGEKIGVVGRTGAGKSSLTKLLFRLLEVSTCLPQDSEYDEKGANSQYPGHVIIDGVDTSTLGLRELRSRLSIISQDPVLFSGTIRSNLDPFKEHSDEKLWQALTHVNLTNYLRSAYTEQLIREQNLQTKKVEAKPTFRASKNEYRQLSGTYHLIDIKSTPRSQNYFAPLSLRITENGSNLSLGQRQLVCLARAFLKNSSILVVDEATASVDNHTDTLIQTMLRNNFKRCTTITIAHRLHTIMDSDRVMVLDRGVVREFDTPFRLLQDENGLFTSLVNDTGPQEAAHLKALAQPETNL